MAGLEMATDCRASLVIPCLNEIGQIEANVEGVARAIGTLGVGSSVEVIYVDGGSTDGTFEYLDGRQGDLPSMNVVSEIVPGIGHARRLGARLALARAAMRRSTVHDDFWILSSDADVSVPGSWLNDWMAAFDVSKSLMVAGKSEFPPALKDTYPNASKVFAAVGAGLEMAAKNVGFINLDGTNSAIERKAYAAVGPFEQPYRVRRGKKENLAGEDWDMGTRGRLMGMVIERNESEAVIVSARRFENNAEEFFNGSAYEKEFLRVESDGQQSDINALDVPSKIAVSMHRQIMHAVCKPILVDPSLLERGSVIELFGQETVSRMKRWIGAARRPDLFHERNRFILDYLANFHKIFGASISEALLAKS